jgi:DNA-binding CsgD family transcriptional regulator
MKTYKELYQISPRETEVLQLTANELTVKEIADELFISAHTAVSHRKNLMSKWNVKNMAGLVRKGFELGVLTLSE